MRTRTTGFPGWLLIAVGHLTGVLLAAPASGAKEPAMAFRGKTAREAHKRQDEMRAKLVRLIWPAGKPELPTSFKVSSSKDHSDAKASYKLYEIWFTAAPTSPK